MIEQIKNYYENYDEEGRLFRDKAHLPEWLTTIRYFDSLFTPGSRILDACAGTGRYAFYLAEKGHIVTACDLVEHNVEIMKSKPGANKLVEIAVCNSIDLSRFEDNSFDVVLCMGALYHLWNEDDKQKVVSECVRVCKPDGIVALTYITKAGAVLANINEDASNMAGLIALLKNADKGIFFCDYPREIENIAALCGLEKIHHIGTDGMSQAFASKLNAASDENFNKYMEYHYATCEDESIIGTSVHGLWIGKKK